MIQDTFFVPKSTGTYADTFLANGLAALIDEIFLHHKGPDRSGSTRIIDRGSYYQIRLSEPLDSAWLEEIGYFNCPAYYLVNAKQKLDDPSGLNVRDIDQTWEQVRFYAEQRKALFAQKLKSPEIEQQLKDQEPPHDWQVVAFIGDFRMQALNTYDRLVEAWAKSGEHVKQHISTILQFYANLSENHEQIIGEWKKLAKSDGIKPQETASQLLNPHQGKGQNRPKPDALNMQNVKDCLWLDEILKAGGLWHCLIPRKATDNEDWKVYAIAPLDLNTVSQHEVYRVFNKYVWKEYRGSTSLKTDITSLLLFYRAWLDYVETLPDARDDFDAELARAERVVKGFHVVQFKKLSQNAYAMVNQSFLSLPAWGNTIHTWQDVTEMKALLDEHLHIVRDIEETHSDGYDLLRHYRDFIAGENWEAFFDFAVGYSHEIIHRYNQGATYVPCFSTLSLRRLFMTSKKPLSHIIESQGFQNVAAAIRYSTVIPQGRKAKKQDNLYEVRYGLGTELKRKATVRDEFITGLTDFMHAYNQENVQKAENREKQMRKDLRTSDIEELVHLIDEYGCELVANLLVAYGYAREPRSEDTPDTDPEPEPQTETL